MSSTSRSAVAAAKGCQPNSDQARTEPERSRSLALTQTPEDTGPGQPSSPGAAEASQSRRDHAQAIRQHNKYRQRLTKKLFDDLEPLLDEPTPEELLNDDSDNAATRMLHYQMTVMDEVIGKAHWRLLTHYEDDGTTARVFVVIGNRLGGLKLDPSTGELIAEKPAEIHLARDAWGGFASAGKGNTLMASETVVAKRLLARLGPGREGTSRPRAASPARREGGNVVPMPPRHIPDATGVAGAGQQKATDLQVKDLHRIIRRRRLPHSQVANLIRRADGQAPVGYRSEHQAKRLVDRVLSDQKIVLAADLVAPLRLLLEQATPTEPLPGRDTTTPSGQADEDTLSFEPGAQTATA